MEKKFRTFVVAAISVILLQGVITFLWLSARPKTAYINTETVYNDFELKKKREADLKNTQNARQLLLDSLRFQLEALSVQLEQEEYKSDQALAVRFATMRDSYYARQREFEEANTALADQYTEEIWGQLNTYIKEYGEQEDLEYIFGASGDGSLMYANDAVNVTDAVNEFVNARYTGK
jgi:outer membrane protein